MTRRILLLSDDFGRRYCLSAETLRRLDALGHVTHLPADSAPHRVAAELSDSWALLLAGWDTPVRPLGGTELDDLPGLTFIGCGQDGRWRFLDVPAALDRGVRCVDASGAMGSDVAEFALGLLLCCLRDIPAAHHRVAAGGWIDEPAPAHRFTSLRGRRVGIVGMGGIGRGLVELLRPFGCQVEVSSSYLTVEQAGDLGVRLRSVPELCASADVLFVATQPRRDTAGVVDAGCVGALRRDAVVVLVGRAATVDTSALFERVRRGELRLGVDVYDAEPLPAEHPLRTAPGVVHTPHIAGLTVEANQRIFAAVVDDLARHSRGARPRWATSADRYRLVDAGRARRAR